MIIGGNNRIEEPVFEHKLGEGAGKSRNSQGSIVTIKSKVSNPSIKVSARSSMNYNQKQGLSECLLKFEKLMKDWTDLLKKEYESKNKSRKRNTIQSSFDVNQNNNSDFYSKVSPLNLLVSYLTIIEASAENHKDMVRKQLFQTLRREDLPESMNSFAKISRKHSFDMSSIHKRHNSTVPGSIRNSSSFGVPTIASDNSKYVKSNGIYNLRN